MAQSLNVHHLLVDYFEASLEACYCCDTILEGIHSMRLAYRRITRVVKLSKTAPFDSNNTQKDMIYRELASFALKNNPLSVVSTMQFRDIHDIIVGLVAAQSIVGGLVGLFERTLKRAREWIGTSCSSRRLCEQLDVAAKGVYILINDLDTMSRMVKRLHDEVEHRKTVADLCVKNGKYEILKQVMSEFRDHESSFLDQLEELEEHIYLCFLTINRSRRLLMQEITERNH
ncbi:hypothetical protein SESBI_11847 [Sesbania bispinosa]|nr:hypothetical protein SESBI_11847 [Sesbania bispinosa]